MTDLVKKLADALEVAAGQYGSVTDEQRNEWTALVQDARRGTDLLDRLRRQMAGYAKSGRAADAEQWMQTVTAILGKAK